jgi:hypothetical protein
MSSYISSSSTARRRLPVLGAIAAAAVMIFSLYALGIEIASPHVGAGQDQETNNFIAIERFVYDGPVPEAAIVGSSLSRRIPDAALGARIANLALVGKNPLVGLRIIARSGRVPRRVFIEINGVGQPVDNVLLDQIFAEPRYSLKRYIKALRVTFKPANVVVSFVRRMTGVRDSAYFPKLTNEELHQALIARWRGPLDQPPDPARLADNIAEMERLAGALTARGAQPVFFEMPIEPMLEDAPGVLAIRQAAHTAFPADCWCWNDTAAPAGLPTRDGLHLDSDTAAQIGSALIQTACHAPPPH